MPLSKYLIFVAIFLFTRIITKSQDTPGVWGRLHPSKLFTKWLYFDYAEQSCKLNFASAITSPHTLFYIIGDSTCNGYNRSFIVIKDTLQYLMQTSDFVNIIEIDQRIISAKKNYPDLALRKKHAIKNMPEYLAEVKKEEEARRTEEERTNKRMIDSLEKRYAFETDSLKKLIDKSLVIYREKNWVLWEWSWSYSNEYSKFVDVDITVINPYKKKMKYIWFTFVAFNPVGDPVRHGINGKSEITVKGIGPIDYADRGTYNFEDVFYSNVIDRMKVKQIKIQFFDGTYKVISNPRELKTED